MTPGDRIDLATHPLTRSQGMHGEGTVTAIRVTDRVNHRVMVYVRTKACVLHLDVAESELEATP